MKLNTSLLTLTATAVFVGSVCAQTPIDITGSTAGRKAVNAQIRALISGVTYAYVNKNSPFSEEIDDALFAIYKGTFLGNPIIIRTNWSGSAAGIRDVTQQRLINFLSIATPTVAGSSVPIISPTFVQNAPEIAFSDVFQSSTAFTSPTLVQQDQVGVIPFKFFKNEGAPVALNNMTNELFGSLYTGLGELSLSMFTGNNTDATSNVFATGNYPESGARITALAETNSPLFTPLSQYVGTVRANVATLVPAYDPDPAFVSGAGVSALLAGTLPAGKSLVGYLGFSDWSNAVAGGATEIAFNGVTLGSNKELIRNGKYTFWSYFQQSSLTLSGQPAQFYNSLRNGLRANPGTGLILINSMNVSRSADGGTVSPL